MVRTRPNACGLMAIKGRRLSYSSQESNLLLKETIVRVLHEHDLQAVNGDVKRAIKSLIELEEDKVPVSVTALVLDGIVARDASTALVKLESVLSRAGNGASQRDRFLAAGLYLTLRNAHVQAGAVFESLLRDSPADVLAMRLAQEAYVRAGRAPEALTCARKTLHLYERNASFQPMQKPLMYLLANGYMANGRLLDAQEVLDDTFSNDGPMDMTALALNMRWGLLHGDAAPLLRHFEDEKVEYEHVLTGAQWPGIRVLSCLLALQVGGDWMRERGKWKTLLQETTDLLVGQDEEEALVCTASPSLLLDLTCLLWKQYLYGAHVLAAPHDFESRHRTVHIPALRRVCVGVARRLGLVPAIERRQLTLCLALLDRLDAQAMWNHLDECYKDVATAVGTDESPVVDSGSTVIFGWLFGSTREKSTTTTSSISDVGGDSSTTSSNSHTNVSGDEVGIQRECATAAVESEMYKKSVDWSAFPTLDRVSHQVLEEVQDFSGLEVGAPIRLVPEQVHEVELVTRLSTPAVANGTQGFDWCMRELILSGCRPDQAALVELVMVDGFLQAGQHRDARTILLRRASGPVTHASDGIALSMLARACTHTGNDVLATTALQRVWDNENRD